MLKLNLGCGQNKKSDYVNVDKFDTFAPDILWDLEVFPWPFETSSVNEILLNHSLEHMGAETSIFFAIIQELYRVSMPGATIRINVPHPRSENFINDPTHVRVVTPLSFRLFSKEMNREWQRKGQSNSPLAMYLDVDFELASTEYTLTPRWQQRVRRGEITEEQLHEAISSYYNVVNEVRIVLTVRK